MKASKETTAVATRKAKRRLENPLTEAQKAEKNVAEVERYRKVLRTADAKCEWARVEAERRCAAGVEWLVVEAMRKLSRRKWHALTYEQKSEKARVEVERRSGIKFTDEQNSEKARVEAERWRAIKFTIEQKSSKAKVKAERQRAIKLTAD